MKVYLASDHGGFALKEELKKRLPEVAWQDLGPATNDRVDYPDFADDVASRLNSDKLDRGILVCGSGQGMAIRANKYPGVRAALCWSVEVAELARGHNDANLLCLGERVMDWDECEKIVKVFLEKEFEGGRHAERVAKISKPLRNSE